MHCAHICCPLDPQALADSHNQWLAVHQDKLPKSLALDGKDLGPPHTLCRHEDGRPVAMASISSVKSNGNRKRSNPIRPAQNPVFHMIADTRAWWEEIKSGKRAFSYKGQKVEYRFKPDGTWETIALRLRRLPRGT